jgi:hypothetical protein
VTVQRGSTRVDVVHGKEWRFVLEHRDFPLLLDGRDGNDTTAGDFDVNISTNARDATTNTTNNGAEASTT